MELLKLENISKIYDNNTIVLDNINLKIRKGELIAIMGPSGSGKSTLLNILGIVDSKTSGNYYINGKEVEELIKNKPNKLRNSFFSFIFQYFALLKQYTVLENVMLPLTYRKCSNKERIIKSEFYLKKVGLLEHKDKKINKLSGGQQQRVAIARALVTEAEIILADEPTGNLDQKTGQDIMELLLEINKLGKTIIIVTHDYNIAKQCSRIIKIVDGKIISDECY
ncbi:ABC transporter ATP-binding protein [Clostridium nigeriense]|uniref:ABC transporter ATP-binding protein n=1 Tax=Clostridium nigeriense TaxID=1805470 RepID=UPI003D345060